MEKIDVISRQIPHSHVITYKPMLKHNQENTIKEYFCEKSPIFKYFQ